MKNKMNISDTERLALVRNAIHNPTVGNFHKKTMQFIVRLLDDRIAEIERLRVSARNPFRDDPPIIDNLADYITNTERYATKREQERCVQIITEEATRSRSPITEALLNVKNRIYASQA